MVDEADYHVPSASQRVRITMTGRQWTWHVIVLVTSDNREVVLSDFALITTDVRANVNSSYIQSFAVDKN